MMLYKLVLSATAVLLCITAAGCASEGPVPTAELARAQTMVGQADKSGTAQHYAAADLQRAHDELSDAERLDGQKEYDQARAQAQRAAVDADLSLARGNSMAQQQAAADIAKANSALQRQTQQEGASVSPH